MKKLLVIAGLWIAALLVNLPLVIKEETPFTGEEYYDGRNHEDVDYQEVYNNYIGTTAGEKVCSARHLYPQNDEGERGENYTNTGFGNRYWIAYGQAIPLDIIGHQDAYDLHLADGDLLVAPCKLVLKTPSNTSEYGTKMVLETPDGSYTLELYHMYCWFCCAKRPDDQRVEGKGFTHQTNILSGEWSFNKGEILGKATSNTVLVVRNSKGEKATSYFFFGS